MFGLLESWHPQPYRDEEKIENASCSLSTLSSFKCHHKKTRNHEKEKLSLEAKGKHQDGRPLEHLEGSWKKPATGNHMTGSFLFLIPTQTLNFFQVYPLTVLCCSIHPGAKRQKTSIYDLTCSADPPCAPWHPCAHALSPCRNVLEMKWFTKSSQWYQDTFHHTRFKS